jgi:hypothetical protein
VDKGKKTGLDERGIRTSEGIVEIDEDKTEIGG